MRPSSLHHGGPVVGLICHWGSAPLTTHNEYVTGRFSLSTRKDRDTDSYINEFIWLFWWVALFVASDFYIPKVMVSENQ